AGARLGEEAILQLFDGEHPIGEVREQLEHLELSRREPHVFSLPGDAAVSEVDAQGWSLQYRAAVLGATAQQRPDAREELGQAERLDEVVVAAEVEAPHAVGLGVAGADEQHLALETRVAELGGQLEAGVLPRADHHVEGREGEALLGAGPRGGGLGGPPLDLVALMPERLGERAADVGVVLEQQDLHPLTPALSAEDRLSRSGAAVHALHMRRDGGGATGGGRTHDIPSPAKHRSGGADRGKGLYGGGPSDRVRSST